MLNEGKNVMIVGHGNSLRAMVKYIDGISDDDISSFEFGHNQALVYEVDDSGRQSSKITVGL